MTEAEVPAVGLPGLIGIDHIGVAVWNLDIAIAFQTEVVGLVLVHREDNLDQGVAEAMLAVAGPNGEPVLGTQLQLLAPLSPESPLVRFLDRSGPGLQQLAYRVSDVAAASDVLRRRGLRLLYDAARVGTRGSLINFLHPKDAGGVLIELVESPPTVPQ